VTTNPDPARTKDESERGSASVYFLIAATAVIVATGLLVDGGETLAARAQAVDRAEQAARAGIEQLQLDELRDGHIAPAPARAIAVAENYLHAHGETGTAILQGRTLTITARHTIASRILQVFGRTGFTATGQGTATLVAGIAAPGDTGPSNGTQP
jgi:Flp pilus assembly protein TadG